MPATPEQFQTLLPFAVLAMIAGPSVASILTRHIAGGRTGLRALGSRLLGWRVGPRWYGVALLTAPIATLAALLPLVFLSREFLPGILSTDDKTSVVLFGIAVALAAGTFEELGWTGFTSGCPSRYQIHSWQRWRHRVRSRCCLAFRSGARTAPSRLRDRSWACERRR